LQDIRQRVEAIESLIEPFGERVTNIENEISELNGHFDTRIDQAIVDIAERIENQRLARRHGNQEHEPSSGPLASVIAKFEKTGVKGTWLNGSFGSNSR
jgi:hypothetical protein